MYNMEEQFNVFDKIDEQLPEFLNRIHFDSPDLLKAKDMLGFPQIHIDPQKQALAQLYVDGYLKEIPENSGRFYLTRVARDFIIRGGYQKHFEREQELRKLSDKKAKLDTAIAQRVYKTYWLPFLVSIASLIIAIIALAKK